MDAYPSAEDLNLIAQSVQKGKLEGYPSANNRLTFRNHGLYVSNGILIVPDGLWYVSGHKNRLTAPANQRHPEVPSEEYPIMPATLSKQWVAEGLMLDQYGRPVHPYWRQLLTDERIGLPTGVGYFYRYGFNRTVDAFVYRIKPNGKVEILIIRRKIEKMWALPGGFQDIDDQDVYSSALRELREETGLNCNGISCFDIALTKIPIGRRTTLNAWTNNTVVVIHANQEYLLSATPVAADDAIDAQWVALESANELVKFSEHRMYIAQSIPLIRH